MAEASVYVDAPFIYVHHTMRWWDQDSVDNLLLKSRTII
jgi:hypothetical protein